MPQKLLTDHEWLDALTRVVEQGPQAAQGGRAPHALQPPERDHRRSPKRAMDKLFERGITVRNQSVLQRGVNDSVETMQLLVQAPRPRQRAPVLRLRARPREGRRGPAHDAADRRSTSRSTCAARPPASTRRRSSSTRRAAAASATRTRFEHYDRETGDQRVHRAGGASRAYFLYFDPIDQLPPEGQARWADPPSTDAWSKTRAPRRSRRPTELFPLAPRSGERGGRGVRAYFNFASSVGISPCASACARRSSGAS